MSRIHSKMVSIIQNKSQLVRNDEKFEKSRLELFNARGARMFEMIMMMIYSRYI